MGSLKSHWDLLVLESTDVGSATAIESPKGFGDERKIIKSREDSSAKEEKEKMIAIRKKRAWEAALAQGKSLPINFMMLYLFGSTIQIYSMTMILMLIRGSVKSIFSLNNTFSNFEQMEEEEELSSGAMGSWAGPVAQPKDLPGKITEYVKNSPLLPQKLAYVAMNVGCLYLALWKCGKLGLVPNKPSDWLPLLAPKKTDSYAY